MSGKRSRPTFAVAAGLVLVTLALAGCADMGGGGSGAMYDSFEEAKNAPGVTLQPNGTQSDVRLRLLKPSQTSDVAQGEQKVVVLVYDSSSNEPITDADFSAEDKCNDSNSVRNDAFCAWMPAMGHGTSPEENPTHEAHGVYVGQTTFSMSGEWQLAFNPSIDGNVIPFDVKVQVGG